MHQVAAVFCSNASGSFQRSGKPPDASQIQNVTGARNCRCTRSPSAVSGQCQRFQRPPPAPPEIPRRAFFKRSNDLLQFLRPSACNLRHLRSLLFGRDLEVFKTAPASRVPARRCAPRDDRRVARVICCRTFGYLLSPAAARVAALALRWMHHRLHRWFAL